jgi:hypothetical protein
MPEKPILCFSTCSFFVAFLEQQKDGTEVARFSCKLAKSANLEPVDPIIYPDEYYYHALNQYYFTTLRDCILPTQSEANSFIHGNHTNN